MVKDKHIWDFRNEAKWASEVLLRLSGISADNPEYTKETRFNFWQTEIGSCY